MAVSEALADPAPDSAARPASPLAVWFGRLGIRARIALGFGIALGLLAIVAGAALYGVQTGSSTFGTYDRITGNNQRLQQFEHDMLDLRRNLLLFIERDDPRFDFHARIGMRREIDFGLDFRLARIARGRLKRRVDRIGVRQTLGRIDGPHAQRNAAHAEIIGGSPGNADSLARHDRERRVES